MFTSAPRNEMNKSSPSRNMTSGGRDEMPFPYLEAGHTEIQRIRLPPGYLANVPP